MGRIKQLLFLCILFAGTTSYAESSLEQIVSNPNRVVALAPTGASALVAYTVGSTTILAELDIARSRFYGVLAVPRRGSFIADWRSPDTIQAVFTPESGCDRDGAFYVINPRISRRVHEMHMDDKKGVRSSGRANISIHDFVNEDLPYLLNSWSDLEQKRWPGVIAKPVPQTLCPQRWVEEKLVVSVKHGGLRLVEPGTEWSVSRRQVSGTVTRHGLLLGMESRNNAIYWSAAKSGQQGSSVYRYAAQDTHELMRWETDQPPVVRLVPHTERVLALENPNTHARIYIDNALAAETRRLSQVTGSKHELIALAPGEIVSQSKGVYWLSRPEYQPQKLEALRPWLDATINAPEQLDCPSCAGLNSSELAGLLHLQPKIRANLTGEAGCRFERSETAFFARCGTRSKQWLVDTDQESDADRAERIEQIVDFIGTSES